MVVALDEDIVAVEGDGVGITLLGKVIVNLKGRFDIDSFHIMCFFDCYTIV